MCFYPEGTVGNVDISPGDDDGVFDGLAGNVDTAEGPISVIRHLDVEGETLGVLKQQRHANICSHRVWSCPPCVVLSTGEQAENMREDMHTDNS